MAFSVAFHHMGKFVHEPTLHYVGGEVYVVHGQDIDRWSYFEALGLLKDFGYVENVKMWWKPEGTSFAGNLKPLVVDSDALELGNHALKHKCEVEIYVEHMVSVARTIDTIECADNGQGKEGDGIVSGENGKGNEGDGIQPTVNSGGTAGDGFVYLGEWWKDKSDTDESLKGVHFSDSEDERALGVDDGFDSPKMGPTEVSLNEKTVKLRKKSTPKKRPFRSPLKRQETVGAEREEEINNEGVEGADRGEREEEIQNEEVQESDRDDNEVNKEGGQQQVGNENPFCSEFVHTIIHELDDEYSSEDLISDSENSDDDGVERPRFKMYRMEDMCKNFKFKLGMEFSSLDLFKKAILEHSVLNGKQVKFNKNDRGRVRVVCKQQECNFVALCSKVGKKESFRIHTLVGKHTCGRVFHNKNAGSKWVAKVVMDRFRSSKRMTINEIIDDIRKNYSTGITRSKAIRARKLALEAVEGDATKQYTLLWSYAAELRRSNRGNNCKLQLNRPSLDVLPRFGSFYMCLDGCKRGFLAGCRPFIGVDGCHLKTNYGGQLLIAVGRDPNDQYFPLAFAVVETETTESWRWFLDNLLDDIRDVRSKRWVFISDQQKGLMPTFDELLGGVEHRFCLRHLYSNFKKKFGGGTLLRDLMMGAVKATYIEAWKLKMQQIKDIDSKAYDWLMAIPTKAWCKHAFSFYPRCDVLMNNLSEAFNSTILLARDKPILTMLEWIRTYLMNRFAAMNEKLSKYQGDVMPKPRKRLDKEIKRSGNWLTSWAGDKEYEVTHTMLNDKYKVDLRQRSCSCNFWELVGIPCRHAVAVITFHCEDPEAYVHRYYHRESYALCYGQTISPINGPLKWPETDDVEILPPMYKQGPGRPKKLRRREPDEPNPTKLRRSNTTNKCRRRNSLGHNSRRCPLPPPPPEQTPPDAPEGTAANQPPAASQPPAAPQGPAANQPPATSQPPAASQPEEQPVKKKRGRPRKEGSQPASLSQPVTGPSSSTKSLPGSASLSQPVIGSASKTMAGPGSVPQEPIGKNGTQSAAAKTMAGPGSAPRESIGKNKIQPAAAKTMDATGSVAHKSIGKRKFPPAVASKPMAATGSAASKKGTPQIPAFAQNMSVGSCTGSKH